MITVLILLVIQATILHCGSCQTDLPSSHHPSDTLHYGNLFLSVESHVHTLAWTIDLNENCKILTNRGILQFDRFAESKSECEAAYYPTHLLVTRKIHPFKLIYEMVHPYFKIYHKIKKNKKTQYLRSMLQLSRKNKSTSYTLDKRKHFSICKKLFLKIKSCVESFLHTYECVEKFDPLILRRRVKRSTLHFNDPLYKKQWHLVSIYLS